DDRGPAAHAEGSRDAMLVVLHDGEGEAVLLAEVVEAVARRPAVEGHDGAAGLVPPVQRAEAAQLREARRRPRLPEDEDDPLPTQPVQGLLVAAVVAEAHVRRALARRDRPGQGPEA